MTPLDRFLALDETTRAYWLDPAERALLDQGYAGLSVNRLIAGMASAGDLSDIDREIERYKEFAEGGLTELSIRLFDDPMDGLRMIGERVLPAVADL